MYIPIAYWQPGGQGTPHMRINWFHNGAETINYYYDGVAKTTPITTINAITAVCMDATSYTNFLTQNAYPGGGAYFCTATPSGSSTCCINCYPQTGPEAWYIDVNYQNNFDTDMGTYYYNYIDQTGNIINDTLTFGQTKRIISQSNPLFRKETAAGFTYGSRIAWTVVSKFPGEVLAYPYKDIPALYTMTLKRATYGQPSSQQFNTYFYNSASVSNGFYTNSNTGSVRTYVTSNIGDTSSIICVNPPMESSAFSANVPNAWITSVTPLIGALYLTSCTTTHSLWVTLNNNNYYNTGSVLKVTNTELTNTASCWTVTNLTSSLSQSVALRNVNVSTVSSTCFTCLSGSLTSSLNVDYLLVAGGGGGGAGASGNGPGAGGGAGGLLSGSYTLQPNSNYNIVIGSGGAGGVTNLQNGSNGQNSTAFGYTSIGGGGGAGNQSTGSSGGSGGGSGAHIGTAISGGLATSGQGNIGGPGGAGNNLYAGGGGGGASSAGTQWIYNAGPGYLSYAGSGGSGSQWLDGNYYAGGGSGGGGNSYGINPGTPGIGGGGTGGDEQFQIAATAGQANKGAGGGGGASFSPITGASGSTGVSIIRYPGTTQLIGGGNVTISGGYVYHTFTSTFTIST